jgi:CheY-like chemotaxis protein
MTAAQAKKRILLIEDDRFSRTILTLMLERLDFEVVAAQDGIQGLELFRRDSFDLVVLDLLLPGLTGFQTALELRGIEGTENRPVTPILALTASPLTETRHRSLEHGITEWASKPVSSFQLALIIERCLSSTLPHPRS